MAQKIATTVAAQNYVQQRFADLNKSELVAIMQVLVEGINGATATELNMPVQAIVGERDGLGKVKAYNEK